MQQQGLLSPAISKDFQENLLEDKELTCIFEAYYKRIFNYIFYRVCCYHTAEDLTSQVFEKVMLKMGTYTKSKAPFEVWMFAIARNVVNDFFRSKSRRRLFSLDTIKELVSKKKDPESIVIKGETNDRLMKAMNILDARERNIVALKFGSNLKNKEIAKVLSMTESNIGIIIYRAMKKLRDEMEREGQL
jgi:RNA polymerase sigma-70 factor (ECF subfamily)